MSYLNSWKYVASTLYTEGCFVGHDQRKRKLRIDTRHIIILDFIKAFDWVYFKLLFSMYFSIYNINIQFGRNNVHIDGQAKWIKFSKIVCLEITIPVYGTANGQNYKTWIVNFSIYLVQNLFDSTVSFFQIKKSIVSNLFLLRQNVFLFCILSYNFSKFLLSIWKIKEFLFFPEGK